MFQSTDLFAQIAGAGDLTDYAPRIEDGEHILALNTYEVKQTRDYGTMVSVDFVVIESTTHKPGTTVGDAWFVGKPGTDGEYAKKRALAFGKAAVIGLGGDPEDQTPVQLPNGQVMPKGLVVVQQTLAEMSQQAQPWRGLIIRASASKRQSKKTGKQHTNVTYKPVTQTVEQIHACRARIEASSKAPANLGAAPAAAPAAMAAPMAPTAPAAGYQQAPAPVAPQAAPAAAPAPQGFGLGGSLLNR